jgi:hypothetical protein
MQPAMWMKRALTSFIPKYAVDVAACMSSSYPCFALSLSQPGQSHDLSLKTRQVFRVVKAPRELSVAIASAVRKSIDPTKHEMVHSCFSCYDEGGLALLM